MPEIDTDALLTKTEALLRKLHFVEDSFGLKPNKDHIGTCIGYSDLVEMRADFIREIQATLTSYVFSAHRQKKMRRRYVAGGRDESAAYDMVRMKARDKFRPYSTQGQLMELLLFNLLQHFFKAAPLLRKMPMTTSPGHERFGADAFHFRNDKGNYRLYLGEAKAYRPGTGRLGVALKDAIESILGHHAKHRDELNLYIYEDVIPKDLEDIAERYLEGKLDGIEVHLVCLVAYEARTNPSGTNATEILESVISSLRADAARLKADFFNEVPPALLPRLNYVLFPINDIDGLINTFHRQLGFYEAPGKD